MIILCQQVLWAEFRIRSCKPRILNAIIEMEEQSINLLIDLFYID